MARRDPHLPAAAQSATARPSRGHSAVFPGAACPDLEVWGPELFVKIGRRPGRVAVSELCVQPEHLDGALDRLLQTAIPCGLFAVWVSPGYLPEQLAAELNDWWNSLPDHYWTDLAHRSVADETREWQVASLPPTWAYPSYLDEATGAFRGYSMARTMTIASFSGAVLTIDLHPYPVFPPKLADFLERRCYVKVVHQWARVIPLLTRRFGSGQYGQGLTELAQITAGWLSTCVSPAWSLDEIGRTLLGQSDAYGTFLHWLDRATRTPQSLLPLACDRDVTDIMIRSGYVCMWLLDLAVINFTPGELQLGGTLDPVMATLSRLFQTHWKANPGRFPQLVPAGFDFCEAFRSDKCHLPPSKILYYDVYRALLMRYLPGRGENSTSSLYPPLEPDASRDSRFPTVHEMVPDRYSLIGPWAPPAATELEARVQLRDLLTIRQTRVERIDILWMEEFFPGTPLPVLRMTPAEVDLYSWWMRYQATEVMGMFDAIKQKLSGIGRTMLRLLTLKAYKEGTYESDDEESEPIRSSSQSDMGPSGPEYPSSPAECATGSVPPSLGTLPPAAVGSPDPIPLVSPTTGFWDDLVPSDSAPEETRPKTLDLDYPPAPLPSTADDRPPKPSGFDQQPAPPVKKEPERSQRARHPLQQCRRRVDRNNLVATLRE